MRQYMVEILRISSFLMVFFYRRFLPSFPSSRRIYIRIRGVKRRFFLKSAYPFVQTEGAVSNLHLRQPLVIYCLHFNSFLLHQ